MIASIYHKTIVFFIALYYGLSYRIHKSIHINFIKFSTKFLDDCFYYSIPRLDNPQLFLYVFLYVINRIQRLYSPQYLRLHDTYVLLFLCRKPQLFLMFVGVMQKPIVYAIVLVWCMNICIRLWYVARVWYDITAPSRTYVPLLDIQNFRCIRGCLMGTHSQLSICTQHQTRLTLANAST